MSAEWPWVLRYWDSFDFLTLHVVRFATEDEAQEFCASQRIRHFTLTDTRQMVTA